MPFKWLITKSWGEYSGFPAKGSYERLQLLRLSLALLVNANCTVLNAQLELPSLAKLLLKILSPGLIRTSFLVVKNKRCGSCMSRQYNDKILCYQYMTGSTSRKSRLVGGDKGCNVTMVSFPGSPALWTGSFTFAGIPLILIWCDDTWYCIIFNILSLRLLKKVKCNTIKAEKSHKKAVEEPEKTC
jgi:hypothetical protein